jgi:DNA-binding SARP family transcriptional activator
VTNPPQIADRDCPDLAQDIVDQLPYGVVMVRSDGWLQTANEAAKRLMHNPRGDQEPKRCSELFECRAPAGPCEQGCLVARAAQAHEALPEIRIDTAPGLATSALWVTAAPLTRPGLVLLHLRAGDARDRRRRSDPHWLTGPTLRVTALGRTRVDSGEGSIGGPWLAQRPGAVLKYLVCHRGRVVHAEDLAEALWPDSGRHGLNNVRHFVHALRQQLEPRRRRGEPSSFIATVGGGYALDPRRVVIDADAFERAVRDGLSAAAAGEQEVAAERLEHAVSVYGGDLFDDEPYAEWAFAERDRLRALASEALRELAGLSVARNDLARASLALDRLAELEPLDPEVHQTLLAVCLAQGRRTQAARRYSIYKARMARELGEGPGFSLADAKL